HKTVFGAWSVRARPGAQVSTPLTWDEIDDIHPDQFTIASLPDRLATVGDPWAGMNEEPQSLEPLLALHEQDQANGLPDAPGAPGPPEPAGWPARRRAQPRQEGRLLITAAPDSAPLTAVQGCVCPGAEQFPHAGCRRQARQRSRLRAGLHHGER